MDVTLNQFEKNIGYVFENPSLLQLALTHPSHNEHNKNKEDNQRLEFLGDSVLSTILSESLYNLFPIEDEGLLSRKRSVLIRGSSLAQIASKLKLEDFLRMSKAELKNKGNQRSSTLEDAIEAVIGAIFLDGGFESAKRCILNWFGDFKKYVNEGQLLYNPKGQLQEILQTDEISPKIHYRVTKEAGPAHQKTFEIDLIIGKKTISSGKGKTKKEAEEDAAVKALQKFRDKNTNQKTQTDKR